MDIMRDDITAKVIAASLNEFTGTKLYTLQLRYPRIIHAEFMTHRVFSRNASSGRAIPVASMIARDEMFVPKFKYNKPGMQPGDFLSEEDQRIATEIWIEMADFVTKRCQILGEKVGLNIHKQWVNRPLEWFGYIDVVMTSTDWSNWDRLRLHPDAADEIVVLARKIKAARDAFTPTILGPHDWHKPYVTPEDEDYINWLCDDRRIGHKIASESVLINPIYGNTAHDDFKLISPDNKLLLAISAARSCRVSYAKHDGQPSTLEEDVNRCLGLVREGSPVHASPFEHQAKLWNSDYPKYMRSNFRNFLQLRKIIPNESVSEYKS